MRKKFNFGKVDGYGNGKKQCEVTLEVELEEKEEGKPVFTASGTVWNARGTDCIQGGQCIDTVWEQYGKQLENKKLYKEIMTLWEKYHLNDMKAWCEHQNYGEGIQKEIKVHHLWGNSEYDKISQVRALPNKSLTATEEGLKNVPMVYYEHSNCYVKGGIETKSTGWITYDEKYAPEGLIGKVCPVCGKKYGHEWYYMPIEENDLKRIKELLREVQG